jgi:uncharacterized membrane-anchored protein
MTTPGERDQESLEVPAYLGRSRYEGPAEVSYGSIAWVGVVSLLGLVGAVIGFTTKDSAAMWIGLGVCVIFAVGYAILIRRLVKQEREEARGPRERR